MSKIRSDHARACELIASSNVFDEDFYRAQESVVLGERENPISHYINQGAALGVDPHPLFQTRYYLEQNPDVAKSGLNALIHYLEYGGLEKRNPSPHFDSEWYRWQYADVAAMRLNPLSHYVKYGAQEGRNPSSVFDCSEYCRQHPDAASMNPLVHHALRQRWKSTKPSQAQSGTAISATNNEPKLAFPIGHYYSPVAHPQEFEEHLKRTDLFVTPPTSLPGIDLRAVEQLKLLKQLSQYGQSVPFSDEQQKGFRYYYQNNFFSNADATMLHAMMRHYKPKRMIEVGSGFSSAVMLDTNDRYLNGDVQFTFIEPYPERLQELLRKEDSSKAKLIIDKVQRCDPAIFKDLEADDIFFVDSSHVTKTGGDLNYILFEALPVLKPGVVVHFHDIFYPFEYPADWLRDGRSWNEVYILRAFLTNNPAYEMLIFNSFLHTFHQQEFLQFSKKCDRAFGSIWLRKLY